MFSKYSKIFNMLNIVGMELNIIKNFNLIIVTMATWRKKWQQMPVRIWRDKESLLIVGSIK